MTMATVAVIGAGAIGRAHVETIRRSDTCRLAAIAEPVAKGRAYAESLGVRWFAEPRDLLDGVKPDVAIIATPNATHREVAVACIERGIVPLVEKPIASTLADAAAIATASERAGVPVLVGHHRRHNPIIRKARAIIGEGALGRLTNASVLSTFYKPADYFEMAWRREPGGGPILINLIHEIDLIRHLCGEIASVQAIASNAVRGFAVEDSAVVLLRLVNGALVTLNLSDTAAAPWSWDLASGESPNYPPQPAAVQTHFISGTEGSLALPTLDHWRYTSTKSWFAPIGRESICIERGNPYRAQLEHLVRVARGEESALISARDGMLTLQATLAVHKATKTGQIVRPDQEAES
ncbi:Gfo/Idh/MocA family oxidoreductase [Bradyrhizobium sp. CB1650]|uniref:Gfo/Idh/MocA family protein n=1 Tax=Bradyrhizobium sp. CB1650 TaxID=3039153 RepID=UPI002434F036|nr:Gfo/Idh/MocA family oxidoreductase [Bradyrhizobium sp. CB1650]WGD49410.1 Gfo/Idh/MocA family oxidoreductase [Bradyrhizobium sp. CB1650]